MSIYYIAMKIYVFVCTIFFFFIFNYKYYAPPFSYHGFLKLCQSFFKLKFQFLSQFYSMKLLHSYNKFFFQNESVFKSFKHPFIY